MVFNTIKHVSQYNTFEVKKRNLRDRKTTKTMDRAMVIARRMDPFKSSEVIKEEIKTEYGVHVSSGPVRYRLSEAGLNGCISRKKNTCFSKKFEKNIGVC